MSQTIIATAKDPRNGSDIVIYKQTWTVHILKNHSELEDCGNGNDCLTEVVTTLNNPDIIRAGRNPEKEELFIRYTTSEDFGVYQGISVSTRTENNKTFVTTAYHDEIKPSFLILPGSSFPHPKRNILKWYVFCTQMLLWDLPFPNPGSHILL